MHNFTARTVRILTFVSTAVILITSAQLSWPSEEGSFYSIFVESFATSEAAAKRVYKLQNEGYGAFVRYQSTPGERRSYRVYIGRFAEESSARNRISDLADSGISGNFAVVKLPDLSLGKIFSNDSVQQTEAPFSPNTAMEKKAVETNTPAGLHPPRHQASYYLHVGSYLNYNDLRYEMERLQKHDLDPFWIRGFDHGLTWFRLYIGGYPDLTSAENAGDRLIQKKIIPLYTVDNTPSIKAPQFRPDEKPAYNQSSMRVSKANVLPPPAKEGMENTIAKIDAEEPETVSSPAFSTPLSKRSSHVYSDESDFSIGIRASQYSVPEIDDFTITRSDSNGTDRWYIDGKYTVGVSLPASLRINRFLRLEGCPEFSDTGVLNTFFLSLRPKVYYTLPSGIEPFMSAGLVYGVFDWQGPPGDFDDAVGLEVGFGFNYLLSHFSIGADVSYRNIAFTYNPPEDENVVSSSSEIDFSGYSISLFLEYRF